jgi:hypothetical protein
MCCLILFVTESDILCDGVDRCAYSSASTGSGAEVPASSDTAEQWDFTHPPGVHRYHILLLMLLLNFYVSMHVDQSRLVFSFDVDQYVMGFDANSQQSIFVPVLLPGPRVIFETQILSVDPMGRSGQIMCLLYADNVRGQVGVAPQSTRYDVAVAFAVVCFLFH